MPHADPPSFAVAALPLWLAPLVLVLLAVVAAIAGRRMARQLALGGAVAALVLLAPDVPAVLAGKAVLSTASRVARVGSMDLTLGFSLDRFSLGAVVVILAAHVLTAHRAKAKDAAVIRLMFATAGALVAVLSDGLPSWAVGTTLVVTASVFGSELAWPLVRGRLGSLAVGVALPAVALFYLAWSLGGQWLDGTHYLSDFAPRFVVPAGDTAAGAPKVPSLARDPNAKGLLTLVSHPGARVYLGVADESQLERSEPIAISPFVQLEVPAGLQKIVIVPGDAAIIGGDGLEAALVDAVAIQPNHETVISVVGRTVTFREIAEQAATAHLESRRLGTGTSAPLIAAFLAFGILFLALSVGTRGTALADPGSATIAALVAPCAAALIRGAAPALTSSRVALGIVAVIGLAFAAQVAFATWKRNTEAASSPRVLVTISLALAPGLLLLSSITAAIVPLLATLVAAFLDVQVPDAVVAPVEKPSSRNGESSQRKKRRRTSKWKDEPSTSAPPPPLADQPDAADEPSSLGASYAMRLSRIASFPLEIAVRLGTSPTKAAPKGEPS